MFSFKTKKGTPEQLAREVNLLGSELAKERQALSAAEAAATSARVVRRLGGGDTETVDSLSISVREHRDEVLALEAGIADARKRLLNACTIRLSAMQTELDRDCRELDAERKQLLERCGAVIVELAAALQDLDLATVSAGAYPSPISGLSGGVPEAWGVLAAGLCNCAYEPALETWLARPLAEVAAKFPERKAAGHTSRRLGFNVRKREIAAGPDAMASCLLEKDQ